MIWKKKKRDERDEEEEATRRSLFFFSCRDSVRRRCRRRRQGINETRKKRAFLSCSRLFRSFLEHSGTRKDVPYAPPRAREHRKRGRPQEGAEKKMMQRREHARTRKKKTKQKNSAVFSSALNSPFGFFSFSFSRPSPFSFCLFSSKSQCERLLCGPKKGSHRRRRASVPGPKKERQGR